MHPGIVSTGIVDDVMPTVLAPFRSLIHRWLLTPEQDASAALRLATDPGLVAASGRYYVRDRERRSPDISYDPVTCTAAFQLSLNWITAPD